MRQSACPRREPSLPCPDRGSSACACRAGHPRPRPRIGCGQRRVGVSPRAPSSTVTRPPSANAAAGGPPRTKGRRRAWTPNRIGCPTLGAPARSPSRPRSTAGFARPGARGAGGPDDKDGTGAGVARRLSHQAAAQAERDAVAARRPDRRGRPRHCGNGSDPIHQGKQPSGDHRDRPVRTAAEHRPSRPRGGSNRARRPRLDAGRPAGVWLIVGAPGGGRVITAGVRVALAGCRRARCAAGGPSWRPWSSWPGHLRTTAVPGGPVVLVVELGSAAAAERCCRLAAEADPAAQVLLAVPDTPTTAPAQAITTVPPSATPRPTPRRGRLPGGRRAHDRGGRCWCARVPRWCATRAWSIVAAACWWGCPRGCCAAGCAAPRPRGERPCSPCPRTPHRGPPDAAAVGCGWRWPARTPSSRSRWSGWPAGWTSRPGCIATTAWTTPRSATPPGSARCCGPPVGRPPNGPSPRPPTRIPPR